MNKFIWRATSPVFVYLLDFLNILMGYAGRVCLRLFHFRLHPALRKMRDWTKFLKRGVSSQREGLGVVYDKRKWMENYYRNPPMQPHRRDQTFRSESDILL